MTAPAIIKFAVEGKPVWAQNWAIIPKTKAPAKAVTKGIRCFFHIEGKGKPNKVATPAPSVGDTSNITEKKGAAKGSQPEPAT